MPAKTSLKFNDVIIALLFLIGFVFLFFADSFIEKLSQNDEILGESRVISQNISNLLLSLDQITLDTSILNSEYFKSIKSLPQFDLNTSSENYGKPNPFNGSYITVPASNNGVSSGVRYESQNSTSTNVISPTATRTSPRTAPRR